MLHKQLLPSEFATREGRVGDGSELQVHWCELEDSLPTSALCEWDEQHCSDTMWKTFPFVFILKEFSVWKDFSSFVLHGQS